MLETLDDLPAGVIGFEAVGEVHAEDYHDVLIPALEAAARSGPIRLVYVLGDRFDGYSAGASWNDAKLGLEHHGKWERFALVSDHEWVNHLAGAFGWLIPGDFQRFALAERGAAIDWVAGG